MRGNDIIARTAERKKDAAVKCAEDKGCGPSPCSSARHYFFLPNKPSSETTQSHAEIFMKSPDLRRNQRAFCELDQAPPPTASRLLQKRIVGFGVG